MRYAEEHSRLVSTRNLETNMNTTLTININGQLTLERKILELFLCTVTSPSPSITEFPKPSASVSSFLNEMQILAKLSVSRRTLFSWPGLAKSRP